MPNKTIALEWLEKAKHNLEAAKFLFEANHYTDVIGLELHQAIEKTLKAIPAYNKQKIKKVHDLQILLEDCEGYININSDYKKLCAIATDYYVTERYPSFQYSMPDKDEISMIMEMAFNLYDLVNNYVNT